jgi:hypothetical protein
MQVLVPHSEGTSMPTLRPAHRLAAITSTALLAGALTLSVAPAAHAAPVFVDADTHLSPYSGVSNQTGGTCVVTETSSSPDTDVPVVENGPTATATATVTGTVDEGGPVLANLSAQATVTGSVKSVGGNPSALDFSMTGTATNDYLAATACEASSYAGADLDFSFTVAQAGFLHLDFKGSGGGYSEVYFYKTPTTGGYPYYDHYGRGMKFSGTDSVYLPAGTYAGYFEADVSARSNVDQVVNGTASVKATFAVAGAQTEAVAGKGKKYAKLPTARSCATDSLIVTVTGKKKRAAQVKQITFFVNDVKVKKDKKIKKGEAINVPVADDVTADLTAEVKLYPKRKGKPAKTYEVRASYEACS